MNKKLVVLGIAMSLMMVTGCLGEGSESKETKSTKVESGKDGKVEVEFWYSGGKTAVNIVAQIVEEFNSSQDNYNVVINTQASYDETYQKLQSSIAGKSAPDMALINVADSRNLFEKGLTHDINTFITKDSEFDKDDYLEVFYKQGEKGEALFALPAYGTTQVLYYNKEAFSQVGVEPESIKTWQDLSNVAKKIADLDGFEYGWEPMWGSPNLIDASLSNGATLLSEDGKTVLINSKEWVEVWESFRKWIHDDKIMTVNSGGQGWEYWYKTIDDVIGNVAGGYTGSSGDQADLDFKVVGAIEQPGFGTNSSSPTADALQFVMLEGSNGEEKQGVYELMKFFTSPTNQAKWTMNTGYIAVRESVQEVEEFKTYAEENPQILIPLQQATHASTPLYDPTGGKINDALKIAADKVELENIPVKEALDEAQKVAQMALDNLK